MIGGRSALLAATNVLDFGNWLGNYSDVSLLLRGDGTPKLVPLDESPTPKAITAFGDAGISTTVFKYGDSSLAFDGTGDYFTLGGQSDFAFGTGDFTIEMWVWFNNLSTLSILYDSRPPGTQGAYPTLYRDADNTIRYWVSGAVRITGSAVAQNTWIHIAVCRSGASTRLFIDGQQSGSTYTDSTNYINAASRPIIGASGSFIAPLNGFIDDLRVTKGIARYTSAFTPPTAELPANITDDTDYNSVSLLLRGDGTPKLVPLDESPTPKVITAFGDAGISTTVFKYGDSSLAFDGSGDYFSVLDSVDLRMETGSFTIEFWCRFNSISGYQTPIDKGYVSSGAFVLQTGLGNGRLIVYMNGSAVITESGTASINTWIHYALVRSGGILTLYRDGIVSGSIANSTNLNSSSALNIGQGNGSNFINGYIDDLRITKGIARYTADFTPPTAELPANITDDTDYNSVSLLLRGDEGPGPLVPLDESPTPKAITPVGDAGISTTVFKYGDSSLAFDGSGDYFIAGNVNETAFNLGTNDFTLELWMFPNVNTTDSFGSPLVTYYFLTSTRQGWMLAEMPNLGVLFRVMPNTFSNNWVNIVSATNVLTLSQWQHIALTRSSNQFRLFVNGVQRATSTSTYDLSTYSTNLRMHIGGVATGFGFFSGFIDDLRITKGIARYTANFIPPPAELPNF